MTDCSCKALGFRLRAVEQGGAIGKTVVDFVIGDWILVGGYYQITISAILHTKGINPVTTVEIKEGTQYSAIGLDDLVTAANGDVTLQVVAAPDGRFAGRALFV